MVNGHGGKCDLLIDNYNIIQMRNDINIVVQLSLQMRNDMNNVVQCLRMWLHII